MNQKSQLPYKLGDVVFVKDKFQPGWHEGEVMAIYRTKICITYSGWDSRHNEWLEWDSKLLQGSYISEEKQINSSKPNGSNKSPTSKKKEVIIKKNDPKIWEETYNLVKKQCNLAKYPLAFVAAYENTWARNQNNSKKVKPVAQLKEFKKKVLFCTLRDLQA